MTEKQKQLLSKQLSTLARLAQESEQRQFSHLQHLLLVSSSTLGIVVSLHSTIASLQSSRWVFLLALVVLCIACLSGGMALYMQTRMLDRGRQKYAEECKIAILEERDAEPVILDKTKLHVACQWTTYISLPLSYILLTTYAILSVFS